MSCSNRYSAKQLRFRAHRMWVMQPGDRMSRSPPASGLPPNPPRPLRRHDPKLARTMSLRHSAQHEGARFLKLLITEISSSLFCSIS